MDGCLLFSSFQRVYTKKLVEDAWNSSRHLQNKDELSAIYKKTTGEVRQVSNHLGFAAFDSTLPILQLAYELGLNFTLLGSGAYQIGQGNKSKIIMGACSTSDSAIGAMLSDNKFTHESDTVFMWTACSRFAFSDPR